MKTAARRRTSPLPLLLTLAFLLFTAGLAVGWTGASAYGQASAALAAPDPSPVPAEASPLPSPTPIPEADKPSVPAGEAWSLLLVNGVHPLPQDFQVPELTELRNGQAVDSRAYPALQRMMDDCRAAGLQPLICSSYRTREIQEGLFAQEVQTQLARGLDREAAEAEAARWVARPDSSEHRTGLAVDVVDLSYQLLDEGQEGTPVQRWLMAHCSEYGFILRYPTDKGDVTGIGYEPWHYRYVGEKSAREIMESGLCLEEYLEART